MKKFISMSNNSPLARGVAGGTRRGVAKKFIIAIMCVFCTFGVRAENDNAATSKEYVDTAIATKQPTIPAQGDNVVMTFDSTATDGIGTKEIYDESASYAEQQNALVTAGTANAAVQMAIQGEFVCTRYSDIDPTDCWFWSIIKLPVGYTQLEYIESAGRQYINTGVHPTKDIGVSVKYAFMELISQTYIFGSYEPHYYLGIDSSHSNMLASYGPTSGNVVLSIPIADVVVGQPYEFNINYYNSAKVEWVGIKSATLEPKNFHSNTRTMDMFGLHVVADADAEAAYESRARIYYMKITDGETLVRDMVPVRYDSTGALGMYDLVTNTFYTNDGTGTFIAGPVASFMPQNQQ